MLAGCIGDSPAPSRNLKVKSSVKPLANAVAAETTLQITKLMASGSFEPYLSTSHPAGICSAAYDQKNAELTSPRSVFDNAKTCLKSASMMATDRLTRSTYAMIDARVHKATTDQRHVWLRATTASRVVATDVSMASPIRVLPRFPLSGCIHSRSIRYTRLRQ